jgi:hypothetical protein
MLRGAFKLKLGAGVLGLALTAMLLVGLASPSFAFAAVRPVVTHVSPTSGSTLGGNTVTITGSHFTVGGRSNVQYVAFARYTATHVSVRSTSKIVVRAPAHHAGIVNVLVYNKAGQNSSVSFRDKYTYRAPVAADMITAFSFVTPAVNGTITGTNIAVTVPTGTDVTALVPAITVSAGATVSPLSGVAHNFTSPVTYTVTSATGATQAYTVTVTVTPATFGITAFSFPIQAGVATAVNGTITGNSIAVTVPNGTPVTDLSPAITISGVSVSPAAGVPENFTNPVTYTVTSASGATQAFTVTVTVAPASADKAITSFGFTTALNPGHFLTTNVYGTITGNNIAVTVPILATRDGLVPTITVSTGATVAPVGGQLFSSPVDYMVTAADGTTQTYLVTVTKLDPTASLITSFTMDGVTVVPAADATTINVVLPVGTQLSSWAPTIVTSPDAKVSPLSGVVQNFTSPVAYVVTSKDGSTTTTYTVKATTDQSASTQIASCTVNGVLGVISGPDAQGHMDIFVTLPTGTLDVTSAFVTTATGANAPSIAPMGAQALSFNGLGVPVPVAYTVTSADGSATAHYDLIVTLAN